MRHSQERLFRLSLHRNEIGFTALRLKFFSSLPRPVIHIETKGTKFDLGVEIDGQRRHCQSAHSLPCREHGAQQGVAISPSLQAAAAVCRT